MKNGKVTLSAVATVAAVALTAQGVHADEVNQSNPAEHTELTAGSENTGKTVGEVTQAGAEAEPTETKTAESTLGDNEPSGGGEVALTTFEKNGNEIVVNNPKVELDQSNGTGKYQGFTVEYKDINFPDDMEINEGDKVTFELPKEITFQTSYEFDVTNPENAVVGKASTDPTTQTVTTIFNNYFKEHPLNKQMSLKLDAKWTDAVESGKPVTVNFDGTLVSTQIGEEQEIGKDELISKWGSQDKDDPTVINWTIRVNYAKRVLNYVKIIDQMSDNQKLVDDYMVINKVDSVTPWIDKGSAMELVKSISKSEHGFEIKMDRLDRMIYIWYKTKLTAAVKESTNPTNKVELKAENDGATLPPAPILEIPELPLEDIPLMLPTPVVELPELVIPTPEEPVKPQPKQEVVKIERTEGKEAPKMYQAPATLPATGSEFGVAISLFGLSCLMVGSWLKKED